MAKKWDKRFVNLAQEVSTWSKDEKHKVGAVIVDSYNRIVSTGYNGPPRGVNEDLDRDALRARSLHAELNAILFSGQKDLNGCSMYIYPHGPCAQCAAAIVQVGIKQVLYVNTKGLSYWIESQIEAGEIFKEANVLFWDLNF